MTKRRKPPKYQFALLFYDKLENHIAKSGHGFQREPGILYYHVSVWDGGRYIPNSANLAIPAYVSIEWVLAHAWEDLTNELSYWTNLGWTVIDYDTVK